MHSVRQDECDEFPSIADQHSDLQWTRRREVEHRIAGIWRASRMHCSGFITTVATGIPAGTAGKVTWGLLFGAGYVKPVLGGRYG